MENNNNETLSIGIDLGGTNTGIGLVDCNGKIIKKEIFPTYSSSPEEWRDKSWKTIEKFIKTIPSDKIKGIGIGAPCANAITGTIEAATDLPWSSPIPVVKLFKEKTDLPVYITNDANAAAMGEKAYGSAKGLKNFIVLTLGTGVG